MRKRHQSIVMLVGAVVKLLTPHVTDRIGQYLRHWAPICAGCPDGILGNVLFGDCFVRLISCKLDTNFWRSLLSVDGKAGLDLAAG
jgi:hypothetical protein